MFIPPPLLWGNHIALLFQLHSHFSFLTVQELAYVHYTSLSVRLLQIIYSIFSELIGLSRSPVSEGHWMERVCMPVETKHVCPRRGDDERGMPTSGELEENGMWMWETKLAPSSFFSFSAWHTRNGLLCGRMTYQNLPINSCLTLFAWQWRDERKGQKGWRGERK